MSCLAAILMYLVGFKSGLEDVLHALFKVLQILNFVSLATGRSTSYYCAKEPSSEAGVLVVPRKSPLF